ncbi:hypothetical protein RFI_25625 [Reticulomyxa filosa]|uniref:Glycylpeptide N-tetradecanoyltransferase n=1 Tax=Reticulomyxa filosa TaxID=46433 RepID=X6ME92_RETFI|nr:hypothetical protein RFI_25625 [Reticulomyxa filosa]|eukprot:ETO11747.1 hypothetical protein RFI_25625 [Reticulomyxa filosa]
MSRKQGKKKGGAKDQKLKKDLSDTAQDKPESVNEQKQATQTAEQNQSQSNAEETEKTQANMEEILKQGGIRGKRRWEVDINEPHAFWDKEPVPSLKQEVGNDVNDPVEVKTLDDVRKKPLLLPKDFEWFDMDLRDETIERTKEVKMVEINFLCVHKQLRKKRLAPVLIREITRRVNCRDIWQAVYTAGVVIPKPVAQNRYWHRSLNPEKLIDVRFSALRRRMTMPRLKKLCRVNETTVTPGLREMKEEDCEQAWKLLMTYLSKFQLFVDFSLDEFKHMMLPKKGVVSAYVVEDPNKKGVITDFISYYHLPSFVINHPTHKELFAAYSYYNVATKTDLIQLMNDALVLAYNQGFDVFNALDVMENEKFLKTLKFGIGDGHLQYYLYNWKVAEMRPSDVGIVLL